MVPRSYGRDLFRVSEKVLKGVFYVFNLNFIQYKRTFGSPGRSASHGRSIQSTSSTPITSYASFGF